MNHVQIGQLLHEQLQPLVERLLGDLAVSGDELGQFFQGDLRPTLLRQFNERVDNVADIDIDERSVVEDRPFDFLL